VAAAFVFVALSFLGAAMLGWRLVIAGIQGWRRRPAGRAL
jgi:hypothetical protein